MVNIKVSFPGDAEILDYDTDRLIQNIEQHRRNIKTFQEAAAEEKVRIQLLESIIQRKQELMEDGNINVRS